MRAIVQQLEDVISLSCSLDRQKKILWSLVREEV